MTNFVETLGKAIPYTTLHEHLEDEWKRLDLRISLLLSKNPLTESQMNDPWRGLAMSEAEAGSLLSGDESIPPDDEHVRLLRQQIAELSATIRARVASSAASNVFLPLPHISSAFRLTALEEHCLLLCLASELERRYEKLFGYCHDDLTRKHPSVDLAVRLLFEEPEDRLQALRFFAAPNVLSQMLLQTADRHAEGRDSLHARPLRLDERVLQFLLGAGGRDERLESVVRLFDFLQPVPPLLSGYDVHRKLHSAVLRHKEAAEAGGREASRLIICLHGAPGAGKTFQTRHLCRELRQSVLVADVKRMLQQEQPFERLLAHTVREATLQKAALCFINMDAVAGEDDASFKTLALLERYTERFEHLVFLLTERTWRPAGWRQCDFVEAEIPLPDMAGRTVIWETMSESFATEPDIDWPRLASSFRLTPGQIAQALPIAKQLAAWRHAPIGWQDLSEACYRQLRHKLDQRAIRLVPKRKWDELILPTDQKAHLRLACDHIKLKPFVYSDWGFDRKLSYGKGVSMLFAGPPGTGKTMAAEVVANELGLPMYRVDLSQVISKYIGETEKHLNDIFNEAQHSHAILFFDESDAMFGKRSEVKDAHDKYANTETSFLLQKMEEYEGVTIMATNFLQNIDDAFMRRITHVIKFSFPDADYREQIWRSLYPPQTPLHEEIDFPLLASKWQLAGGNIKNIVLSSAYMAAQHGGPVRMKHIIEAARYELQKSGKMVSQADFAEFLDDEF